MTHGRRFILGALASLPIAERAIAAPTKGPAFDLVSAARRQIGVTHRYDGSYRTMSYPGGDVPLAIGVCTDVVIRAYRDGLDIDLQRAVHEDMAANFQVYPSIWGLSRPDRNIDHRRVPNLETFFRRRGAEQPDVADRTLWRSGDLVTMRLPRNLPHIAIVSAPARGRGLPSLIHNIGRGTEETFFDFTDQVSLTARFRYFL